MVPCHACVADMLALHKFSLGIVRRSTSPFGPKLPCKADMAENVRINGYQEDHEF